MILGKLVNSMPAYYVKLLVHHSFPDLYYVLAKKYGKIFRKCFRFEDGKLYGILVGEMFLFGVEGKISIFIALGERKGDGVFMEVVLHGGLQTMPFDHYKRWIKKFLNFLKDFGFNYDILSEIHKVSMKDTLSDVEKEILGKDEMISFLPKRLRVLNPCPFLEMSPEFPDVYICKASEIVYMPVYNFSEQEVLKQCVENRHLHCRHYLEAIEKEGTCPFLKRYSTSRNKYMYFCTARHTSFVKLEEREVSRYCVKKQYVDCKYYLKKTSQQK